MRRIIALFIITAALATALTAAINSTELPKNLLRYNMGALPMTQNTSGAWTSVAPDSIDWKAPYAAVLAGDLGKNLDISTTKTFVIDLRQVESIDRFSLFSKSATGSLTVYSSPIFENPETGKWSELGTLTLNAGKATSLTSTPTDARYVKFVFSSDSKGVIGSMGAFGDLTYGDIRAADLMQQTISTQTSYSLNYATPATDLKVTSSTPMQDEASVLALFSDDPAATLNVTEPMDIVVDMSAARQISSGYVLCADNPNASVRFGNSEEEMKAAKPVNVIYAKSAPQGFNPYTDVGANDLVTARYAQISIKPSNGSTTIGPISLIGPVTPDAFVFNRNPVEQGVAAGSTPTGGLPPVDPIIPRDTTF